ncbi:MAG: WD40 repeat domain-containing protein, partial [Bacteroidetes bacterium]|nr:WD40 repeat domain-containing protein [Bacteroidota bacterium]
RDLFKFYGHTGAVTSIFMNQDQTLITGSEDSTLKTWTTPFALYNQAFSYHRQGVNKVAFSPDQKFIASGGKDRRVVLTDILNGEKVWEHREHADPVLALNFRDSTVQSIDEYSNYIIFHPGQSTAQSIPLGERSLSAAVFSPDGQQVLTGGFDSLAQLWDVNQQTLLLELSLQSSIFSLAFAPDQSVFIIGCEDGKAYLFDPSGNQLQVFEGHQGGVTAVNFTPSSKKIITGSEDQRVILWNLSGQQLQQFREYALPVQAVSVNAEETLLAVAYRQKSAILIDLQEGYVIDDFRGHKDFVNDIIFPKQGNILATACDDKFVRVWTKVKPPLFDFLKQGKLENMDDRMKNQFQIE